MKAATLASGPTHVDPDTFVLPHSLEAERATLGAALLSSHAADYVCDHLRSSSYFRRAHQLLYDAIATVRERRIDVDFLTLKAELERRGKLDDVGGPSYLSALTDGVPRSSNVSYYAGILRDLAAKRAVVADARRTIDLVAGGTHTATAILHDADRRLMDLQAGHVEGRMRSVSSSLGELTEDLDWRMNHRGEVTGIPSGYPAIDELTLGWQAGDLVIIAARPSVGKTTFVVNSAVLAAQTFRKDGAATRIALFSLEMRRRQIEYRILSQLSQVPLTRILNGAIGELDVKTMSESMGTMANLSIEIDDRAGQTAWDVRGACRRLKGEGGLDLVIVDYAQLMPGTLDGRGSNRNAELEDIVMRLKTLADELACPVLLLSQLNRQNQMRTDPRPKLSDLRDSGALEQHADIVGFLHRKNHREGGPTEFILEKQRNGPTGTVMLSLDRDTTTFSPAPDQQPLPDDPPAESPRRRKHS
jgi:replicative DNA helicase